MMPLVRLTGWEFSALWLIKRTADGVPTEHGHTLPAAFVPTGQCAELAIVSCVNCVYTIYWGLYA